jgi:CO/xanthine dehydrogenase Mo-binding subunit
VRLLRVIRARLDRMPVLQPTDAEAARGDADAVFAAAAVKIDATYEMARENHNPMEPHATVAAWVGDKLTLWSKSQYVGNEQAEIDSVFGIPNVQVICPFIGGAFGTSLRTWPHVVSGCIGRARDRTPGEIGAHASSGVLQYGAQTANGAAPSLSLALGATTDGKLTSVIHEVGVTCCRVVDATHSRLRTAWIHCTEYKWPLFLSAEAFLKSLWRGCHLDRNFPAKAAYGADCVL